MAKKFSHIKTMKKMLKRRHAVEDQTEVEEKTRR
jgi:hypothetical protein